MDSVDEAEAKVGEARARALSALEKCADDLATAYAPALRSYLDNLVAKSPVTRTLDDAQLRSFRSAVLQSIDESADRVRADIRAWDLDAQLAHWAQQRRWGGNSASADLSAIVNAASAPFGEVTRRYGFVKNDSGLVPIGWLGIDSATFVPELNAALAAWQEAIRQLDAARKVAQEEDARSRWEGLED